VCNNFPETIRSQTKWQSISIFLVRLWKTGLAAIWRVALSQCNWVAGTGMYSDQSKLQIQMASLVALAMAQYSALVEDRDIVACSFFDFQEIGAVPSNTK